MCYDTFPIKESNIKMNQTQRKHILRRLAGIRHDRVSAYENELLKKLDAKRPSQLTVASLVAGIKDGSIAVPNDVEGTREVEPFNSFDEVFDLNRFYDDFIPDEIEDKVDVLAATLKKEAERIEDVLFLGDSGDALVMIAEFEKFKA